MGCIYRIYHKESGKSYIGQTHNIDRRIYEHFIKHGNCRYLYNAIELHGADAFKWEIICEVSEALLDTLEICYIKVLNTLAPNGYNLTTGGEGGKLSDETKRKRREWWTDERRLEQSIVYSGKNNPNYGGQYSSKQRAWWTPERSQERSKAMSGQNNPMYGKTGEDAPAFGRIGEQHPNYRKSTPNHIRELQSKASKTWWTDEKRLERSKTFSGKSNPNYGSKWTPEMKKAASERAKKRHTEKRRQANGK